MRKHYIVGVIASGIIGFFITLIIFWGGLIGLTLLSIPFGLLAGFIGGRLEKKYAKSTWGKAGFIILTLTLGVLLPTIPLILFFLAWSAIVLLFYILEQMNIHFLPDITNTISFLPIFYTTTQTPRRIK